MSFRYCYYFNEYKCHPETCCHEEHFTYSVYRVEPLKYPFGPYEYGPKDILMQSDSKTECEEYLKQFKNNQGLEDPWMTY
jgi:hypothetical protein